MFVRSFVCLFSSRFSFRRTYVPNFVPRGTLIWEYTLVKTEDARAHGHTRKHTNTCTHTRARMHTQSSSLQPSKLLGLHWRSSVVLFIKGEQEKLQLRNRKEKTQSRHHCYHHCFHFLAYKRENRRKENNSYTTKRGNKHTRSDLLSLLAPRTTWP